MPEPTHTLEVTPSLTIPGFLTGEVQSKMAYVDEAILAARVSSGGEQITLTLTQETDPSRQAEIAAKVQRVVTSLVEGALQPKIQVLEDELHRPVPYQSDPHPELLARGEISQEAQGIFSLGPLVTRLIEYFEERFLELAASFDAAPYRFPTLIPARYLERVNYFRAFPHSLTFATHLREDLDAIDHFAQHAACDEHGLNIFALADQPLPGGQVVATAVSNCFRYESTNLVSLERLWNFTMREVIFVGPKEFVLDNRETARLRMRQVFEEIGLAYRVESATDPFFIGEFRKQSVFQSAFQLKFEIRARLPFKDSTLAVGSYNYHQNFFGRHLNISLPDGTPAHTGCVAFGLERMAYAFLAQYGLDPQAWPSTMQGILQ